MKKSRDVHTRLATLLRESRLAAGITQQRLAELIEKPQSYVSKYESGERLLNIGDLATIASALGTTLSKLVEALESGIDQVDADRKPSA